jgi:hypothetical protein
VMTLCHHWFCKECILGVLSGTTHCPLCRGPVTPTDLRAPGHKPAAGGAVTGHAWWPPRHHPWAIPAVARPLMQ